MARYDCFVSVVALVRNDADIVEEFVADISSILCENYSNYELVLVDDGSKDGTVEKISNLLTKYECIRMIRLSREYGEEIAISAGLDSVIGDFVVVMMPNSDPPELIPKLIEKSRNGSDIVFGIRQNTAQDSWSVRIGRSLFHWYFSKVLKIKLPRGSTYFQVLSRQAVYAITRIRDKYRYLKVFSTQIGYTSQRFLYTPINRNGSRKNPGFFQELNRAIDIAITSSRHPLRFLSWIGLAASILNVLYAGYVIGIYLFKDHVTEGWTTSSLQNTVMFFFVFIILTILAEYVGRILDEVKERPLYNILEERNSNVLVANGERRNVVL